MPSVTRKSCKDKMSCDSKHRKSHKFYVHSKDAYCKHSYMSMQGNYQQLGYLGFSAKGFLEHHVTYQQKTLIS